MGCLILESHETEAGQQGKKRDISKLLAVIPPAEEFRGRKQTKPKEKRIRIRLDPDIPEDKALIHPSLAKELGIKDRLVMSVSGKRFVFMAVVEESAPQNLVIVNEELMKEHGIADNSLVTIRRA